MSFPAPPRRPVPGSSVSRRTPAGVTTTPVPRTAPLPATAPVDGSGDAASWGIGRFRHDRGADAWWWSPEMFAVLGLDPCTTVPSTEALVRGLHPDDRARTIDALTAGRPFALEVRARGGRRPTVLVAEPEVGPEGRVVAVAGRCADLTAGRSPGSDDARVHALETEVEQLRAAMASRAVIEQAKGILMLLTSCGDQTAFDLLGHISSHTHRKVRDVARAITESATGGARLPDEIREILRDACPPTPHAPHAP
jgi:ANTAR domain